MARTIKHEVLTAKLALTQCTDGYWLYDEVRGHNLAMQAPSERDAFVKALTYYQEKLSEVSLKYKELGLKVEAFIGEFTEEDEYNVTIEVFK